MTVHDRRRFLGGATLGLGAWALGAHQLASAQQLAPGASRQTGEPVRPSKQHGYDGPVGIQLYTLGEAVYKDIGATFAMLAKAGYREVQALQYPNLAPSTIRREAANAGLNLRSAHLNFSDTNDIHALLDTAAQFGLTQVGSSILAPRAQDSGAFFSNIQNLNASDYQRIAERANRIGEQARRSGFRYAYHNHNYEFRPLGGGQLGYDILLRETDPALVDFEADCGWIKAAGGDPIQYFKNFPGRFSGLHVKDFDTVNFSTFPDPASQAHVAALGRGVIDYVPILSAALQSGISYLILEHDPRNGVPITNEQVRQEFLALDGWLDQVTYNPRSRR